MSQFGLPPAGYSGPEVIESYYWSTAPYAVSAAVNADVLLFQPGTNSGAPWAQNFTLPPTINRSIVVLGMKTEAAIAFTPGTGASVGSVQAFFLGNAFILWEIESKSNAQFPLVDLNTTENYVFGVTQADREKLADYAILQNPIELPRQGEVKCTLKIPAGLPVTSATASINTPGLGYTNDVGHYVRLKLYCLVGRPQV